VVLFFIDQERVKGDAAFVRKYRLAAYKTRYRPVIGFTRVNWTQLIHRSANRALNS